MVSDAVNIMYTPFWHSFKKLLWPRTAMVEAARGKGSRGGGRRCRVWLPLNVRNRVKVGFFFLGGGAYPKLLAQLNRGP